MTVRVLSAGSTLHGVRECATLAGAELGGAFQVTTDHGHNIRDAVMRGDANADIVLLPADMVASLSAEGRVTKQIALGTVGIGGVVRAGTPVPPIATMAELRAAIAAADAILLTRAPTGDHLMNVIAQLGLHEAVASKLARFDTSTALNIHLAGRADNALGFGPETEIRAGKGVAWVGDVPPDIQIALPYAAAMLGHAAASNDAQAFLNFLAGEAARDAFHRSGVF